MEDGITRLLQTFDLQVLSEKEDEKVHAAVEGIGIFVDTLLLISKTQDEMSVPSKTSQHTEAMDMDEVCV